MAGTMSLPPVHDFEYYIGDTGEFSVTVKNSDQTLYDLTGFTSKFVISNTLSMNPTWSIACESSKRIADATIDLARFVRDM